MSERFTLASLLKSDRAWVQGGILVVLLGGLGGVVWLLRTQPTEFIYSLF